MNLTISAPFINLSISVLFRILHILSILTGPNILHRHQCSYIISRFHSNVELYFSDTNSRVATLMVRVSVCVCVFFCYYRTSYRLQWEL